ncbi:MAG: hypothetical protein ABW046_22595 [Actinoplanes sp.]
MIEEADRLFVEADYVNDTAAYRRVSHLRQSAAVHALLDSGTSAPVCVRDGDILIIGIGDDAMSDYELATLRALLRAEAGVDLLVMPVSGNSGVTVLRPER